MLGDLIKSMIGPIIGPLIDRIPDPNERARAKEQIEGQMLAAMTSLVQGQLEINKEQAKHPSIFVAGARPAIMWICGIALGWNYILQPILSWLIYGAAIYGYIDQTAMAALTAPTLDTSELTTILLGMLGLGGLRTYEKRLGVARESILPKKEKK
jgi:hypothetical protein